MVALWHQVSHLAADGDGSNHQLVSAAVVRLQQDADGEAPAGQLDYTRGCPDTTLKVELLRPGAGADAAFGDGAVLRGVERGVDVLASDAKGAVVAEEAVVGLRHHRDDD